MIKRAPRNLQIFCITFCIKQLARLCLKRAPFVLPARTRDPFVRSLVGQRPVEQQQTGATTTTNNNNARWPMKNGPHSRRGQLVGNQPAPAPEPAANNTQRGLFQNLDEILFAYPPLECSKKFFFFLVFSGFFLFGL